MMSATVVICAYASGRYALLQDAVRSVQSQTLRDVEIVVVIDHNPALLALTAADFPDVKVIPNEGARGLSDARNTGMAHATRDVIAFIDDDATADADWLERLVQHYHDPKVLAVGGRITPTWPAGRPHWFPAEFDWVIGCSYKGQPEAVARVRNLIGCNMSVRRTCLHRIEGFRTGLGRVGDNAAGCEETDFFIRLRDEFTDGVILLDPSARVHHVISPNRTHWPYFIGRCRAEGRGKAALTRLVGTRQGLESEGAYVRKVLPAGVLRGLRDALQGDFSGLARSGAIIVGFLMTASSYAARRLRLALSEKPRSAPFAPIRIVDTDLASGLTDLVQSDRETGKRHGAAWCLIRQSGQPVKIMEIPFDHPVIPAERFRQLVQDDRQDLPPLPIPAATGADAPHVTVVISTRERSESLARCLDSLLDQTYPNMDIVVVDNAPTSSTTFDLISQVYAPTGRVRYVLEPEPGLGRAHNTGVAAATGEVIAFTDDDVIVDRSWVAMIAANFFQSPRIGCVTGLILPAELETRAQYWTERHGGFGKGLSRRLVDPDRAQDYGPLFPYAAGAFGSGANMAFRREALLRMGGFDPALGAGTIAKGGDDLAGIFAALDAGYQLVYEPGAIVWHHHRRSEEGMRRQAYGYGVGLGAYLTKLVVDDPRRILLFARKLPAAARHLFSPRSAKMSRLPDDYPRRLVWSERLGILMGIPCYLRSLNRMRRAKTVPSPAAVPSE